MEGIGAVVNVTGEMGEWGTVPGHWIVRLIAVLLLFVAGGEVYACDVSEACVSRGSASDGCDQPSGDNCLCCCCHILPVPAFSLDQCDFVEQKPCREIVLKSSSLPVPIDHPPQL
jgi:hypothetical protein